jgi:hypothetical protein
MDLIIEQILPKKKILKIINTSAVSFKHTQNQGLWETDEWARKRRGPYVFIIHRFGAMLCFVFERVVCVRACACVCACVCVHVCACVHVWVCACVGVWVGRALFLLKFYTE